jgi:hypothetical protein
MIEADEDTFRNTAIPTVLGHSSDFNPSARRSWERRLRYADEVAAERTTLAKGV